MFYCSIRKHLWGEKPFIFPPPYPFPRRNCPACCSFVEQARARQAGESADRMPITRCCEETEKWEHSGPHIKATCPECGKYVRFVGRMEVAQHRPDLLKSPNT